MKFSKKIISVEASEYKYKLDIIGSLNEPEEFRKKEDLLRDLLIDMRPVSFGLLHPIYVYLYQHYKNIVNPNNKDGLVVNILGGPSISEFLLSTNATKAVFIDKARVSAHLLKKYIRKEWNSIENHILLGDYLCFKKQHGYAKADRAMHMPALKIAVELKALGISPDMIKIIDDKQGVTIKFKWAYKRKVREYSIKYLQFRFPESKEEWREAINLDGEIDHLLRQHGLDKFLGIYMKAALKLPRYFRNYIRPFAERILPSGYMLIDTKGYKELLQEDLSPATKELGLKNVTDQIKEYSLEAVKKYRRKYLGTYSPYGCDQEVYRRI
ncbi:hypothetical protein ACFL5G_03055 [Candidatus Margulisiibacteriota bacterium]